MQRKCAPIIATKSKTAQSSGMVMNAAKILGAIKYCLGSIPITSSASICSETRMVPSRAAIAPPARAATIKPVSTGPSSRVIPSPTVGPTRLVAFTSKNPK